MIRVRTLSLGAGVQSTTLALMAARGEVGPMPDAAIFSDTGWEPQAVYTHLAWLMQQLPFPVHIVTGGDLRGDIIAKANGGRRTPAVPFFTRLADGKKGMMPRQCTRDYKVRPVRRKTREMLGHLTPKGGAEQWLGISTDEATRMKPSQVQYIVNRWPLIEKAMSRQDCLAWLERNGYPRAPKSACIGCPYHDDRQWLDIKADPVAWADAVAADAAIRNPPSLRGQQFMHRSCVPLDEVNFQPRDEPDLFNNDCEGMCGV